MLIKNIDGDIFENKHDIIVLELLSNSDLSLNTKETIDTIIKSETLEYNIAKKFYEINENNIDIRRLNGEILAVNDLEAEKETGRPQIYICLYTTTEPKKVSEIYIKDEDKFEKVDNNEKFLLSVLNNLREFCYTNRIFDIAIYKTFGKTLGIENENVLTAALDSVFYEKATYDLKHTDVDTNNEEEIKESFKEEIDFQITVY
jgi:hypothetical protein